MKDTSTDTKNPNNVKNLRGTRPAIKENFVLSKISADEELKLYNTDGFNKQMEITIRNFFERYNQTKELTTFNLVQSLNLFDTLLIKDPKLQQTLNALKLRTNRFRMKYYLCYQLCKENTNSLQSVITELEELLGALMSKVIRTDYKDPSNKNAYITEGTTLALIAAQMREVEGRLRRMIPHIHNMFGVDKPEYYPKDYNIKFVDFIRNLHCSTLEIPPDWVYIFHLLCLLGYIISVIFYVKNI